MAPDRDDIPHRPFEGFPVKPLVPPVPLPLMWNAEPGKVTVSFLDQFGLWAHNTFNATKTVILFSRVFIYIIRIIATITQESIMEEKWYQSRRVWTTITALLAGALTIFKVDISAEVQSSIIDVIMKIVEIVAWVMTIVLPLVSRLFPKKPKEVTP